jgi:hypothetical protein
MIKTAIALRLWSLGLASPLRVVATTVAAWCAVQAHSAAVFVAAPIVLSFPLEQVAARRVVGALQAIRNSAEVVLLLQVPFLIHAFAGTAQAVPTRFLASASESLGPRGHLRFAEAGRSILFESGYIFASPGSQWLGVLFVLAGCALFVLRYGRDLSLVSATIAPPLFAWAGFSLWRGNYDSYWYLPLVPSLAVATGLGFTALRFKVTSVALLALVLAVQPHRIRHSHSWLRMPQYGPLVRGSRAVIRHANPVRNLDTTFELPPLSDRHFPFEAMGGRFRDDAAFDAVIDERGDATFRAVDR